MTDIKLIEAIKLIKAISERNYRAAVNDVCDEIKITEYCPGCKHETMCRDFDELKRVIKGIK